MSTQLVKKAVKNVARFERSTSKLWRCTATMAQQRSQHRSIKEAEQLKLNPICGKTTWYTPNYDETNNCMYVQKLFVQDVFTGNINQFQFDAKYLDQFAYKNLRDLVKSTKSAF